jgi:rhodanese-related sulfurtransferase
VKLSEKLKGAKRPLVIDVRKFEEYRTGHIPGSKLIPLGELAQHLKELPKDREIVCVCASGSRSSSATRLLLRQGYNAVNMNGGMSTWVRAGLSMSKGS